MRVLVTGGAGFIGSHYVRQALACEYDSLADAEIMVLDSLTYAGNEANLAAVAGHQRLTFVHGDIRDADLVQRCMRGVDLVVHLAAESHVDRSIAGAGEFVSTNVLGTQVLLEAAATAGVGKFVHVSTDEVYGTIEQGAWPETDPLHPNSPYAASKASADLMARAFHRTHGVPVCITRCSNNYGPYQYPEKVIPLFVTNLLDGEHVPLYGDGLNVRDWLHVGDHCRGIQLVADAGVPGEIYNIGGGTELTNKELTAQLLEAVGAGWDMVEAVPDRWGHDRRYSVDTSKIRAELGYRPSVPFSSGLADTVRWYARNRHWWEPLKMRSSVPAAAVCGPGDAGSGTG